MKSIKVSSLRRGDRFRFIGGSNTYTFVSLLKVPRGFSLVYQTLASRFSKGNIVTTFVVSSKKVNRVK